MENISALNLESDQVLQGLISESPKLKMECEGRVNLFLKKKSDAVFQERGEYADNEIAGVYFQGIQYFDFENVYFINNTGIANLIDLLKSLLKQGVVIKLVNVREKIKDKFKSMGLEYIFNCA